MHDGRVAKFLFPIRCRFESRKAREKHQHRIDTTTLSWTRVTRTISLLAVLHCYVSAVEKIWGCLKSKRSKAMEPRQEWRWRNYLSQVCAIRLHLKDACTQYDQQMRIEKPIVQWNERTDAHSPFPLHIIYQFESKCIPCRSMYISKVDLLNFSIQLQEQCIAARTKWFVMLTSMHDCSS